MSEFGLKTGLRAVRLSLLGVWRANRHVEVGVRVVEGRGEDVSGPEICAEDEARNLSLGGAVAGLSRGVHKCSDRVVATGGLAQGTAGGVSRDPDCQAAQGTGSQGLAKHRRRRTESTYSSGCSTDPWCGLRRHNQV